MSLNEAPTMWAEEMLGEAVSRYVAKTDPLDQKLLLLFRTLGIKYRLNHTILSDFQKSMHVSQRLRALVDVAICDFGFNYLSKTEMNMILIHIE
jgi:hypothetical protein